jgi:hypothetical protein
MWKTSFQRGGDFILQTLRYDALIQIWIYNICHVNVPYGLWNVASVFKVCSCTDDFNVQLCSANRAIPQAQTLTNTEDSLSHTLYRLYVSLFELGRK